MNIVNFSTTEKKVVSSETTSNYFAWILKFGILIATILGFIYLILLNKLATQGFALESLKNERLRIQQDVESIEIAIAIPSSLYALSSNEQTQEMTNIKKVTFLEVEKGEMAFVERNLIVRQ
jgi:hypothetical protein